MPGLESYPQLPRDSVDVRLVDWDGAALYDWMHYIVKQGSPIPGVNGWGIDPRHRIALGVASGDAVPALRAYLERLGVACGLVIIENVGPVSLASRERPMDKSDVAYRTVGTGSLPTAGRW